jgi:hypothetical protein
MTVRLLMSELFNDGSINQEVFEQVCKTFEAGVCTPQDNDMQLSVCSIDPCKGFTTTTQKS